VVYASSIGFRGGNSHTGDLAGWVCRCGAQGRELDLPERCSGWKEGDSSWSHEPAYRFEPYPGEVIVRGVIAQGDAGRMGSGEQLVATLRRGAVARAARSGRLYGAPRSWYYRFDGGQLQAATWEQRVAADLWFD
jgi:hypothetical protein